MARLSLGGGEKATHGPERGSKAYLPFKKYTFYLDLRCMPQLKPTLTQYIHTFGGRIEEFFSRKVVYLVTDKPKKDWPSKGSETTVEGKEGNEQQGGTHEDETSTAQAIRSTKSAVNNVELVSRGKLLLSKAGPSTPLFKANSSKNTTCTPGKLQTTTDVLQLARASNVKIIQAMDMKTFCESHSDLKQKKSEEKTGKKESISPIVTTKLEGHYIKIEDNQGRFRPIYKEFTEWPEINLESQNTMCPFSKKRTQQTTGGLHGNGNATNEMNTNKTFEGLALKNHHAVAANNHQQQQQSHPQTKKQLEQITQRKEEPAKKLFCEICQEYFIDLIEHLKTEKHELYVGNKSNYKELENVARSIRCYLPNEEKRRRSKSNTSLKSDSSGSEDEEEMQSEESKRESDLFSPFSCSRRNNSLAKTTIQLSGSKHTSHQFVALHDLVPSPILADHNRCLLSNESGYVSKEKERDTWKCNQSNQSLDPSKQPQEEEIEIDHQYDITIITTHDTHHDNEALNENSDFIPNSQPSSPHSDFCHEEIMKVNVERIINGLIVSPSSLPLLSQPAHHETIHHEIDHNQVNVNVSDGDSEVSTDYSLLESCKRPKFD